MKLNAKYFFLLCLFFVSCSVGHGVTSQQTSLPEKLKVQVQFSTFWNEVSEATNHFENIKKYVPSPELIARYNLQKQGAEYIVSGYFKTTSAIPKDSLLFFKGEIVAYTDIMYGFHISLSKLPNLISIRNLDYIELSSKVYKR
jgi:hypothetical protein